MIEIDGYTDLEVIGRGGFAVVYKARQISVGRDVAIKLLTAPSPDEDLVRRFKRESQAVGALSWHPHIAAVVDAGSTADGQAFIVFELLSGGSLEERLEQGSLAWNDAVSAMIQVADAVEAAHRAGVMHRDVKPANILLDRIGVAKLGDFGIASMQDGSKTETGMLATTVAHAAPELFDGEPASPATDVYALGSTLHTLVTGVAPFDPKDGERIGSVIARIASDPPPRPDPTTVPPQIATVIAHALAKQPQYRPRSAAAFGQALKDAQRALGQQVTAMPVTDSAPLAAVVPTPTPPATSPLKSTSAGQTQPHAPAPPVQVASVAEVVARTTLPASAVAPPLTSNHLPAASGPAPFSKTIAILSVVAVLLAAGVGGLILYQMQQTAAPVAITDGGARILAYDAFDPTELPPPFDAGQAIDRDATTLWGIGPGADGTNIVNTSYVITLAEDQRVVAVGVVQPQGDDFGRASQITWGTAIVDQEVVGEIVVSQPLRDEPGPHMTPFDTQANQIVLAITGVHGDPDMIGIAEILIEVEGSSLDG